MKRKIHLLFCMFAAISIIFIDQGMAGADKVTQEKELGSNKPNAPFGDPEGFAVIEKSFLKIDFRNEGPGKLSRRDEDGKGAGFLPGTGVIIPALLSR